MSYGSPQYSNGESAYEVSADGPDVSADGTARPLRLTVTAAISEDQDEAEADAAFQALIDLINGSPAFTTFGGVKRYGASVSITATP